MSLTEVRAGVTNGRREPDFKLLLKLLNDSFRLTTSAQVHNRMAISYDLAPIASIGGQNPGNVACEQQMVSTHLAECLADRGRMAVSACAGHRPAPARSASACGTFPGSTRATRGRTRCGRGLPAQPASPCGTRCRRLSDLWGRTRPRPAPQTGCG